MATPEKHIPPIADRAFVKWQGRRTDRPVTTLAASGRWEQSRAIRAKVKGIVPEKRVRPTVAGGHQGIDELRARFGSRR